MEQRWYQDAMAQAADGEEFGDALQDGEQDEIETEHANLLI
jgi:hypothetical protein